MDKTSPRILKDSLPCTLTTITRIVNNSFYTNTFARAWPKTAEVTPILKCGNPDVPNNYRPFSLLPIVSKVTERLVHGQLMEYLIGNNKLAVHQSGNRKLHSTETALLYVTDQLLQVMDDKKVSIMVLLDMSKAFDSIRHDVLLSKLQSLDFSQSALDWFLSYLSTENNASELVTQFLKFSHSSSEFRKVLFQVQFCLQSTLTTSFLFLNVVYLPPMSMTANCICPSHLPN